MLWLLIILLLFIGVSLYFINASDTFFKNRKAVMIAQLIVSSVIILFQIISGGLGAGLIFILALLVVGILGYIGYVKGDEKIGFILTYFCTFFQITFLFLQLYFQF